MRWATESGWALETVHRIGSAYDLDTLARGLDSAPGVAVGGIPENECRVTMTKDPACPVMSERGLSRADVFFGPLRARPFQPAHTAHLYHWCCDADGTCLIDDWIPWSEIEALPVHLRRSA